MSNVTGIDSGPMPPENNMMKVFTIMINDTKPLWMYCATKGHCQKGMVMAINAPSSGAKTLAAYKAAAEKATTDGSSSSSSNSTNSTNSSNSTGSSSATGSPKSGGSTLSVVDSMAGPTGIGALLVAMFALLL
jgi:hypothetical protein